MNKREFKKEFATIAICYIIAGVSSCGVILNFHAGEEIPTSITMLIVMLIAIALALQAEKRIINEVNKK